MGQKKFQNRIHCFHYFCLNSLITLENESRSQNLAWVCDTQQCFLSTFLTPLWPWKYSKVTETSTIWLIDFIPNIYCPVENRDHIKAKLNDKQSSSTLFTLQSHHLEEKEDLKVYWGILFQELQQTPGWILRRERTTGRWVGGYKKCKPWKSATLYPFIYQSWSSKNMSSKQCNSAGMLQDDRSLKTALPVKHVFQSNSV